MNYDILPYTRSIMKSTYILNYRATPIDCRMLFILSGEGEFTTEEHTYELCPGVLIYYPCGVPYHVASEKGMLFYTLNFDFTSDNTHIGVTMPEPSDTFDHSKVLHTIDAVGCENFQKAMYIKNAPWARGILEHMHEEEVHRRDGYKQVLDSYLRILIAELYRKHTFDRHENPLCKRIKGIVGEDITLNIREIAEKINYHPFYLNQVFRKNEGISLHGYIMKKRLITAHELISTTRKTLEEIAILCGFSSHSHLTTAFKSEYGMTPTELRR